MTENRTLGRWQTMLARYPALRWVLLLLAFLTLISPWDVLPDLAPVLGFADDLLALLYLLQQAIHSLRRDRRE